MHERNEINVKIVQIAGLESSDFSGLGYDLISIGLQRESKSKRPGVVVGCHLTLGGPEPEGLEQRCDDQEESVLRQDLPRARSPSSSKSEQSKNDNRTLKTDSSKLHFLMGQIISENSMKASRGSR